MKKFAALFDKIDQTQSTNEKVHYIKEYFIEASASDGAWALFFLSGHRLKRLISGRTMLEWCQQVLQLPDWLIEEAYEAVGDTAETISLLLRPSIKLEKIPQLSLSGWMQERILPLRQYSDEIQKTKILEYWSQLTQKEIFILNKILTGGLRVGVSHLLTLRALSQALEVPSEVLSHRLMGKWEPTPLFFENLKNEASAEHRLNPYPFYLASPFEGELAELGSPAAWQAEWKWDGIRAQAICRVNQCVLWSRGNELISAQFPEILESLKKIPLDTVLDGEILAYRADLPLPFGSLQKRLGLKRLTKAILEEVPLIFMMYDLLEYQGEDYRQFPLSQRRKILESLNSLDPRILLSPTIPFEDWHQIEINRSEAKSKATEGVMLKKLDSPYGIGRQRGNWWKYKIDPMTIDAVLIYAQAGKGRRANLYTDYTFGVWDQGELVPIAKAYSGLSQEEIDTLDRWIRRHTEEKFGPVRKVKAEQVFEIAFEGIQVSKRHKSGVALRFPRIVRWRQDKPYTECDTLDFIKKAYLHDA